MLQILIKFSGLVGQKWLVFSLKYEKILTVSDLQLKNKKGKCVMYDSINIDGK